VHKGKNLNCKKHSANINTTLFDCGLSAFEMVLFHMDAGFLADIKFNCDVSDAQFWGYYSVCGLLMRYRDLYRSEIGMKPWADIPREKIGAWIEAKESKWPELEKEGFRNLTLEGRSHDPFDVEAINAKLIQEGLVYGAGYGMYLKPTFFLAKLRAQREVSGLTVYTSGLELVRDLFTSPGMLRQNTVFLRLEPLTILLLYKHSELNTRHVTVLEDAFAEYGFPNRQIIDITFEQRLEQMADRYSEILLAHELGEAAEAIPEWKDILALSSGNRQLEHYLRAVKDLIADTSDHGPYRKIIETRDRGALSLSIALIEGFRRMMYPEIREAYTVFSRDENWSVLESARYKGYEKFRSLRDAIMKRYHGNPSKEDFIDAMRDLTGELGTAKSGRG
jgi:hypothetical protein